MFAPIGDREHLSALRANICTVGSEAAPAAKSEGCQPNHFVLGLRLGLGLGYGLGRM